MIRTPGVDRIQSAAAMDEDLDRSLRPRRLEDFVGQAAVKDQLAGKQEISVPVHEVIV